ncbi:hypothetical protein Tco_1032783 [Tanacetum coccineum]|uniref:Uncharacterized protein n=1 Tax=Tanacetum coccineum TaxID=301880 RepID=A0ABQ5GEV6_9ASTR
MIWRVLKNKASVVANGYRQEDVLDLRIICSKLVDLKQFRLFIANAQRHRSYPTQEKDSYGLNKAPVRWIASSQNPRGIFNQPIQYAQEILKSFGVDSCTPLKLNGGASHIDEAKPTEMQLTAIRDADFAGCHDTQRITSVSSSIFLGIGLLAGHPKKQKIMPNSPLREAEYIRYRMTCALILWDAGSSTYRDLDCVHKIPDVFDVARALRTLLPLLGVKQMSPEALKEYRNESISPVSTWTHMLLDSIGERLKTNYYLKPFDRLQYHPVWILSDVRLKKISVWQSLSERSSQSNAKEVKLKTKSKDQDQVITSSSKDHDQGIKDCITKAQQVKFPINYEAKETSTEELTFMTSSRGCWSLHENTTIDDGVYGNLLLGPKPIVCAGPGPEALVKRVIRGRFLTSRLLTDLTLWSTRLTCFNYFTFNLILSSVTLVDACSQLEINTSYHQKEIRRLQRQGLHKYTRFDQFPLRRIHSVYIRHEIMTREKFERKFTDSATIVQQRDAEVVDLKVMLERFEGPRMWSWTVTGEVANLNTQNAGLLEKVSALELVCGELATFCIAAAKLDDRIADVRRDMDNDLYPNMLTSIAGRRWGLEARIVHGKAGRSLTQDEAYDPMVEGKYVIAVSAFENMSFPLLDELEGLKDYSLALIMSALTLKDDHGDADTTPEFRRFQPSLD